MGMAERIKERRLIMNYTQEELAEKLGLQKSAIAKYENGRVENIKRSVIARMSDVLECSPAYLMGWDEPPERKPLSKPDQELLRKYHYIDEKGKHTVDTVVEMEYNRCKDNCSEESMIKPKEDKSHLLSMAAHNDTITEPEELEKTMRDLAKLKRPKK